MKVKMQCKCGKVLRANERYAGKTVDCPHCGARVKFPDALPVPSIDGGGGADRLNTPTRAALDALRRTYKAKDDPGVEQVLSHIQKLGRRARSAGEFLLQFLRMPSPGAESKEGGGQATAFHVRLVETLCSIGVEPQLAEQCESVVLARFARQLLPDADMRIQRSLRPVRRLLCEIGGTRSLAVVLRQSQGDQYETLLRETQPLVDRLGMAEAAPVLHGVLVGPRQGNPADVRLAAPLLAQIAGRESIEDLVAARQRCQDAAARACDEAIVAIKSRGVGGAEDSWWGSGSAPSPASPVRCPHCGHANNKTPTWPRRGNDLRFNAQTDLFPAGAYHFPMTCTGCGSKLYVVWEEDPR